MQNLHESKSPIQLENLLQVPLQVIRLEDLIREKASSVSPNSLREKGQGEQASDRLCRSVDSQPQTTEQKSLHSDPSSKKAKSTSCLFDCCTNPRQWGNGKYSSDKINFKTTSVKLPDGSTAVVPIMDFNEGVNCNVCTVDSKGKVEEHCNEHLVAQSERKVAEISTSIDGIVNIVRAKNTAVEGNVRAGSGTPSPPVGDLIPSVVTGSASSSPTIVGPAVVLGKVTEKPTRYEDFLLAHGCNVSNKTVGEKIIIRRGGDSDSGGQNWNGGSEQDTLRLTFYNDGRKESEKEFRPDVEGDVRYFKNQQLQMSRVARDAQRQPNTLQQMIVAGDAHRPVVNDNTQQFPYSNNNNTANALPQPKLTSSNVQDLNNSSSIRNNGKIWEQWDGLQISRCQKEIITLDGDEGIESVARTHYGPADQKAYVQDRILQVDRGESENSIERHLQSYLTSLKYVKPGTDGRNCNTSLQSRIAELPSPDHKGKSITRGTSGLLVPEMARASSPEPCEAAQIKRIPNTQVMPQFASSAEPWSERTIAKITTRPYLRRLLPAEPSSHSACSSGVNAPSAPKRFRSTNLPTNPLVARHKQQHFPRFPNPNNTVATLSSGSADPHNHLISSGRNAIFSYNNLQQQQAPTYHNHSSSPQVSSPQHSPLTHLQSSSTPNPHDSMLIAAATAAAANTTEAFDSNSYYERLRRYWEYYQRQELDWTKLSEYYQKYHFYPWDTLTSREDSLRQWRGQQQQQHQISQHHLQQHQGAPTGTGTGRMEFENLSQQQHQLALRAMNAAALSGTSSTSSGSGGGYLNNNNTKGLYSSATPLRVPAPTPVSPQLSFHDRNAGVNVSPPSASQIPIQTQNKYSHNTQQLQQLKQLQQRHLMFQQQQQHQQQLRYQQEQQQNAQQMALANYEIKNSIHYRNAYNQLAQAVAAVSSASAVSEIEDRSQYQSTGPMIVASATPSNSPEEIAHPVNIHRQTLQLAIKNNFRNGGNNGMGANSTKDGNAASSSTIFRRRISSSPPRLPFAHHQQQQSSWANKTGGATAISGVLNMRKDSLKTVPSAGPVHQTSVIRRIRQQTLPSTFVEGTLGTPGKQVDEAGKRRKSLDKDSTPLSQTIPITLPIHQNKQPSCQNTHSPARNREGNCVSNEMEQVAKTRRGNGDANIETQLFRARPTTDSPPIPTVVLEEEVVTTVSPSSVLINSATDGEIGDDSGGGDKESDVGGPSSGGGGGWKYDHVVLLDKRIRTYMCRRCFETLKTEQQIRNHLFCKMLANHVQCHVCLQLFTSDAYPAHLQIHGVRPPDAQDDE